MRLSILASVIEAKHSDILYHITTDKNANKIIKEGHFLLKPGEIVEVEFDFSGNNYFLSTARTLSSNYFEHKDLGVYVVFVLDGRKLANKYKIRPVNFFGDPQGKMAVVPSDLESEDRILSKTSKIPLWPYVKEVIVGPRPALTLDAYRLLKSNKVKVSKYASFRKVASEKYAKPFTVKDLRKEPYTSLYDRYLQRRGIDKTILALIYLSKLNVDQLIKVFIHKENELVPIFMSWIDEIKNEKEDDLAARLETLLFQKYSSTKRFDDLIAEIRKNKLKSVGDLFLAKAPKLMDAWRKVSAMRAKKNAA